MHSFTPVDSAKETRKPECKSQIYFFLRILYYVTVSRNFRCCLTTTSQLPFLETLMIFFTTHEWSFMRLFSALFNPFLLANSGSFISNLNCGSLNMPSFLLLFGNSRKFAPYGTKHFLTLKYLIFYEVLHLVKFNLQWQDIFSSKP